MSAPVAEVLTINGRFVTVRCPYCHRTHEHTVETRGRNEHRAPGCGPHLSADARAAGYLFGTQRKDRP